MIRAYSGYKAERSGGAREKLPAGGYVGKVLNAKVQHYDWGDVLVLVFDIAEGEYTGFFHTDFENNTNEDKKWRGTYRLNIPKDNGDEKDAWSKRTFNNAVWAFEESNAGYAWDWEENKLKNKTVGLLYRDREWEINGNTGWTTECCALTSAEDIRSGNFKMPNPKALPEKPNTSSSVNWTSFAPGEIDDAKLPF